MPDNTKGADQPISDQPIVVMAGRSTHSYLMINELAKRFTISQVIFEHTHTKKMIQYRLKKLGAWIVTGQLLFLMWDRLYLRPHSQPAIDRLLAGHDITPPDSRIPTCDVDSVNTTQVIDLVRAQNPGAVVVTGTGIIGKKLLSVGIPFINIHCGITPRYRGVHGAFWAVVEGKPEVAGTTIHLIDPGVDTGAIIAQATIAIEPTDTYRTLPIKQYLVGLPLMKSAVENALNHQLSTFQRNDLESCQWYSPTPIDYWRYLRNLKKLV